MNYSEKYLKKAKKCLSEEKYEESIAYLSGALQYRPEQWEAVSLHIQALNSLKRYDEAVSLGTFYLETHHLSGNYALMAYEQLAKSYEALGNTAEASDALKKAAS